MSRKFEAIISILDKASAPLLAIENKMRHLGSSAKKTEVEIKSIGMASVLKSRIGQDLHAIGARLHHVGSSIHEHLGGPMEKVGHVVEKIVEAVPIIGSIGGVGSVAGIVELVNKTSEATEQLTNLSNISGISTAQLQTLQFAAKDTGVSTDALARGMGRLNERLGKAAMGQNKQLAALFNHLHVSLRNADGSVKSASQQLPVLMQALHDTHNPALRAAIAMQAFGRSGVDLLPFLDMGSTKLAEQTKRWKEFGYTFGTADIAGLEKFHHAWNDLETAVGGFLTEIAADFAPVLAPIIKQMASWVALNRGLISADLKSGLKWLETTIEKFDWHKFETNAGAAFKVIIGGAEAAAKIATELDHLINGKSPVPAHPTVTMANVRNPFAHVPTKPIGLPSLPTLPTLPPGTKMVDHGGFTPRFPALPAPKSPTLTAVPKLPAPKSPTLTVVPKLPALPRLPAFDRHVQLPPLPASRPRPDRPLLAPVRAPMPNIHRPAFPRQGNAAPQPTAPHKVQIELNVKGLPAGVTMTPKIISGATMPHASRGQNGTTMEITHS